MTSEPTLQVFDHIKVLNLASKYVDSACSKTCIVGSDVTWDVFKDVYMKAYLGGSSGCTTFRSAGKRYGILNVSEMEDTTEEEIDVTCFYDPETGQRTCE